MYDLIYINRRKPIADFQLRLGANPLWVHPAGREWVHVFVEPGPSQVALAGLRLLKNDRPTDQRGGSRARLFVALPTHWQGVEWLVEVLGRDRRAVAKSAQSSVLDR